MKKLSLIFLIGLSVQSCDYFRRMAGRPTSDDIQAKRELIAEKEKASHLRQTELEAQRGSAADSLKTLAEIGSEGIEIRRAGNISDGASLPAGKRYFIIIGSYRTPKNLKKVIEMVEACGFTAVPIEFDNGCTSVGVSPSNRIADCLSEYHRVRKLPFCPDDSWILDVGR